MLSVNIHPAERALRATVGLVVLSLVEWGPESAWGFLGLVPLASAVANWCPLYASFGISTCSKKGKRVTGARPHEHPDRKAPDS
jgi:hypothetical protein